MNKEGSHAHNYASDIDVDLGSRTLSASVTISHLYLPVWSCSSERQSRHRVTCHGEAQELDWTWRMLGSRTSAPTSGLGEA